MKISTLRANFKFPRGFVFCRKTHKIYLPFERVGSKFAFPKFQEMFEAPWSMNDYYDENHLNARWDILLEGLDDIDVYPVMLTRCPYERFISTFEVIVLKDQHWPENLFNFKIRRLYNLNTYLNLVPSNTEKILEAFDLFTKIICEHQIDYSFINPITENFKDLNLLSEILIIDLYKFTETSHNKTYTKEKMSKITKQEYFANPLTRQLFYNRFKEDITRFGYSL